MDIEIGRGDLYHLATLLSEDISKDETALTGDLSESNRDYLEQYIRERKELLNNLYIALNAPGQSTIVVRERQQ